MKFKENLDSYFTWFRDYVSSFYCNDININRNITIKEDHTLRVVQNIRELLRLNNISEEISILSILTALFHDIGRFKQFTSYGTFSDKDSEDHAELGVRVLRETNVLSALSDKSVDLILNAILVHNKKNLYSKSEDPDMILISKLIRDADKLDILKVLTRDFNDPEQSVNPALQLDLPDNDHYSEYAIKNFFNNKTLNNNKIENRADFKLLLISWIYDLNFDHTLQMIKKRKYIESLLSVLPQNDMLERIKVHTSNYIKTMSDSDRD